MEMHKRLVFHKRPGVQRFKPTNSRELLTGRCFFKLAGGPPLMDSSVHFVQLPFTR
jgi:hypothetical protein